MVQLLDRRDTRPPGSGRCSGPIETLPLFVRPGSIVPMGPFLQYSNEKPADPIELRIYAGANGTFTLYEDEGDTYRYEKGAYATIPFTWDDAAKTLTIGARKGEFPGMLKERTFNVVGGHRETRRRNRHDRRSGCGDQVHW